MTAFEVSACGGAEQEPARSEVTRSDLGDRWPLVVDTAVLQCNSEASRPEVTVEVDGRLYALSTLAYAAGHEGVDGVLRRKPDGTRYDTAPLLERGLAICQ